MIPITPKDIKPGDVVFIRYRVEGWHAGGRCLHVTGDDGDHLFVEAGRLLRLDPQQLVFGAAWKPIGPDTPEGVWLITYRAGERGPTSSILSRDAGEDVWSDPDGRDTVTHSIYAPPTHWLTVMPPLRRSVMEGAAMNGLEKPTKYRVSQWADLSDLNAPELPYLYGIQAFVPGKGWHHCTRGFDLLLFKDADLAEAELNRLCASLTPGHRGGHG